MNLIGRLSDRAEHPHGINLKPAKDRGFWESLDPELLKSLVAEGRRLQAEPWSVMLMSHYRDFKRTGNRAAFEEIQFSRRIKLSALVMAECAEHKGFFTGDIIDGLFLILGESSWCLPAHNSYERDHPQEPLPDITKPVVDLFAAETAAVIAVAEALLRDELSAVSGFIEKAVDAGLEERIFRPYLDGFFWWMGDGKQSVNNWTVWITQNILLAVLTRRDPGGKFVKDILTKAAASTDFFLDEYEDDGACDEGAQYYSHAALCLFGCLELMDEATDGAFRDAFSDTKIRNIAAYITRVYAGNGYYVNYADCASKAGKRSAREYVFGKRCSIPELMALAAEDYRESTWSERLLAEEHNLWYRLLQAEYHREMLDFRGSGQRKDPGDFFFGSTGMMVSRDEHFVLAAKAGDNGDSHNHNDVGSIILYRDGEPFIIDLGVETYTARTFSAERYDIWTMQSLYHNVPFFTAGDEIIQQKPGESFSAVRTQCITTGDRCSLTADIAGAYGDPRIRSVERIVSLIRGKYVEIRDTFDLEEGILATLVFITYREPELTADRDSADTRTALIKVGALGYIEVDGTCADDIRVECLPITDDRLKRSWDHDCYRVLIPVHGRTSVTRIRKESIRIPLKSLNTLKGTRAATGSPDQRSGAER